MLPSCTAAAATPLKNANAAMTSAAAMRLFVFMMPPARMLDRRRPASRVAAAHHRQRRDRCGLARQPPGRDLLFRIETAARRGLFHDGVDRRETVSVR